MRGDLEISNTNIDEFPDDLKIDGRITRDF